MASILKKKKKKSKKRFKMLSQANKKLNSEV